ncbi:hypothetical protein SAMN04488078_101119 [Antarctobacter heliothermus]|uniref:Uncharacterized protein n=1 Tax=Antarctobacter heliothermus TaxID=74033 RepID=A0A239DKR4_9RHOB|nr:hypothetical protein SAMN04488078_101119 [Antarctobacter heliothermus]
MDDAGAPALLRADEASRFEFAEVFEKRGQGHVMSPVQVRDRGRAGHQPFDHRAAGRIGEGTEECVKMVSHVAIFFDAKGRVKENLSTWLGVVLGV